MPLLAITYKVQPGHDEQIAEIFSPENFTRADSPVLRDENGDTIGYLTATSLFLCGDVMVRVIQHDGGTADDIAKHMAVQEGVRDAERALAPYLAAPRDTETVEGFLSYFGRSSMRTLHLAAVDNRPAAGIVALLYRIHDGRQVEIAASFDRLARLDGLVPDSAGPVIAVGVFLHHDVVVLAVQHDGCPDAEAIAVAATRYEPALAPWLTPHLTEPWAAGVTMRCISRLSAAQN
jgi:hypothetical protein